MAVFRRISDAQHISAITKISIFPIICEKTRGYDIKCKNAAMKQFLCEKGLRFVGKLRNCHNFK